jgi:hypothetical protein
VHCFAISKKLTDQFPISLILSDTRSDRMLPVIGKLTIALANRRIQIFGKPILSVSEYEGMSTGSFVQFAEENGRFETRG